MPLWLLWLLLLAVVVEVVEVEVVVVEVVEAVAEAVEVKVEWVWREPMPQLLIVEAFYDCCDWFACNQLIATETYDRGCCGCW